MNRRRIGLLAGALVALVTALVPGRRRRRRPIRREPTDYESRIDAITPDVDTISVRIVGGDAFIELTVDPGTTVDRRRLRRRALPAVPRRRHRAGEHASEATYLNESRYGRPEEVDVPADLPPDDEPDWRTVANDGNYAWHDHRVHWMSPDRPPDVEPGDIIQTQDVDLVVDGEPVAITVSVILAEPISPLPWLGLVLVAAVGISALGWKRGALPVAAVSAAAAAVLAVVAGQAELAEVPAGAGGTPLVVIVPAIALVTAGVAGFLLWRGARGLAGVSLLASAACLGGWGVLRITVLFKPVLPTTLPFAVDRAATALAVGVAAAVAVLVFHSGAVAPAPLEDEVEPAT